jgi:type IV pilus assembly protein PilV
MLMPIFCSYTGRVSRHVQSGFSLLEVLISIVVLSIGALGAAGMQVAALKDTGSANSRYRAASLASGMTDTLRANRTAAVTGASEFVSALAAGTCSAVAVTAVTRWANQIDCELPGGKGSVEIDTFTKRAIVTVEWDDSRGKAGLAAQQFKLETRL